MQAVATGVKRKSTCKNTKTKSWIIRTLRQSCGSKPILRCEVSRDGASASIRSVVSSFHRWNKRKTFASHCAATCPFHVHTYRLSSDIAHNTSTSPDIRIIALIPVHAAIMSVCSASLLISHGSTHKVLRPARRGCVAHDPPSVMLCFPSKKSAASC